MTFAEIVLRQQNTDRLKAAVWSWGPQPQVIGQNSQPQVKKQNSHVYSKSSKVPLQSQVW